MTGFVYKWTNLLNKMWYIGSHKGHLYDGYVGSGIIFNEAIQKYGIKNFKRTILYKGADFKKQEEHFLKLYNAKDNELSYNLINISTKTLDKNIRWRYINNDKKKRLLKEINPKIKKEKVLINDDSEYIFDFGSHKGQTLEYVFNKDYQYLEWCHTNRKCIRNQIGKKRQNKLIRHIKQILILS